MKKSKPKVYHSIAEIPEHHYVPALLTPRGRPRRGVKTEPSKVHAVRIKESAWQAFCAKAKAAGLTANAALQLALRDWTTRT